MSRLRSRQRGKTPRPRHSAPVRHFEPKHEPVTFLRAAPPQLELLGQIREVLNLDAAGRQPDDLERLAFHDAVCIGFRRMRRRSRPAVGEAVASMVVRASHPVGMFSGGAAFMA